jgi:2-oxoglutarate dehydrogenase E2 component (dihydrolipoamide succinyltransferase)
MDDLTGGNFSISNPGIFNSLFGTPVINYPQAAVFNMNTIKDRVIAVDGKPEIRPVGAAFQSFLVYRRAHDESNR